MIDLPVRSREIERVPVWWVFLLMMVSPAFAGGLTDGFGKALKNDPTYQAALAEYEGGTIGSTRAGRAYWPEVGFKVGERSESSGMQRTVQIAQPVVDVDRYATLRGATPLQIKADATMRQREGELVVRYYKAVADLVRAKEGLALNKSKSEALNQQAVGAQRALELGTGTVTDLRDAQVRLAQAKAEALMLQASQEAAERQYIALTGEPPGANSFVLVHEKRPIHLPPLKTVLDAALVDNPAVIVARQVDRLADLDVTRKYGQFLPKLNMIAKQTSIENGQSAQYIGVSFDFPLQSGNMLDVSAAKANLQKSNEELRAAEQKVNLDGQRLYAAVEAGKLESEIRLEVIAAAELSLQANEKSFLGGVRSRLDVLNSIQQLSQTRQEYVTSRLALGDSLISLQVVLATPAMDILKQVESLLF